MHKKKNGKEQKRMKKNSLKMSFNKQSKSYTYKKICIATNVSQTLQTTLSFFLRQDSE
jgi:hypothetical protein